MSEEEVKYQFLDFILYKRNIYHEFCFEPIKNAKLWVLAALNL